MARRGLSTEKLVQEGMRLVSEKGADSFSVRALADRLGVKPASLYNHMESAGELMEDIGRQALIQLESMLEEADAETDPEKVLIEKALAYRRFARKQPHLYKMILRIPHEGSLELQEKGRSLNAALYPLLEALGVPEERRIHCCRALRSAMHGFVSLEEAGFFAPQVDPEESYVHLMQLVIGGLQS